MAGKYLAIDSPVEADIVVGVPESGNAAALGYSLQSGIPYGTAFVKIVMWAEHLLSQNRVTENQVFR